jgi:signal transduction histidine kinase/ligand-binding sensor domain-containing protein
MIARPATIVLTALLSILPTLRAQEGSRWRVYRTIDGMGELFTVAVTISPRGNVWAKHGSSELVSWLDGYQVRTLRCFGTGIYPLYESRSGQLWSGYSEGLMEYRREQWLQYPVADIRLESAVRLARRIPLLPAERDHVLALLPDRLLEYDAGQDKVSVLRRSMDTQIGRFIDLIEARDGGAWISASNGLAKLPGPIRRLTADSPWHQISVDPGWRVHNLERPFEDDEGGVTVVADSLASTQRMVLHFDGLSWGPPVAVPDRIRGAWRGPDQMFWAFTRTSLLRRRGDQWEAVDTPGVRTAQRQIFDAAMEANGVFWLATSEGLIRHAPQIWRSPLGLGDFKSPVYGILEDRQGGLWFAVADALLAFQNGEWRKIAWPETLRPSFAAPEALFEQAPGKIAINTRDQPWFYDSASGDFSPVIHPSGRRIRAIVGQLNDERLCFETVGQGSEADSRLEVFDGEKLEVFPMPNSEGSLGTNVVFLRETQDGTVWVGNSNGLVRFDPKRAAPADVFPGSEPTCLLETVRGRIWRADSDTISEFDGRAWRVVRAGLGQVRSLQKGRDGSIWVATDVGLFRHLDGSWVGNSVEEGLPDKEVFKVWQDQRGQIWAATGHGVSQYHREADTDPPVAVVSAVDNPQEVSSSEIVTLVFRGRDKWEYTSRTRILYSHRLDEGPWSSFADATSASFTNLLAGKHRFAVRAMDRNWNEQTEPELYEFASVVPWYQEPRVLALGLAALVVTVLLASLAANRHLRLVRSYAEVERMVEQRTKELERANQELLHSQKMRALGTLAAGIAHDFNNILSIIKGSVQIIEANPEEREKIKTRVDRIKTVVEQGSGIVKAMLGFSRVIEKKDTLVEINQVVADTIRLLGDQFLQDVTLRLEPAPALPKAKGVADLIQQMLLNFIINAADAMGGHGTVVLRTGMLDRLPAHLALAPAAGERFVFVSVQDAGCGIAPEILPRIFEPFFTTKAFSTRRGTGLGLSMVYEIAKELGFGLRVESFEGKGSLFTIIMPTASEAKGDG